MATVDIIIRTKNRPLFLARALDNVLAQEFSDWHLFVVKDGDDASEEQALIDERDFGNRCTVIARPDLLPQLSNIGIAAGTGEFIAIHDDDDTWHPAFLARTVEHLRNSDDLAVATRIDIVWEEQIGNRLVETGREGFHPAMLEVTYFDLLRFNHVVPIGMVFRRSAYDELGPMDERCEVVDDWVFNLSLAQTGRFGLIDEVLAFWHQRRNARGDAGNTVIAGQHIHHRDDRRVRDRAVREYVAEHGAGGLLYLAKYIDERNYEVITRLDRLEAQQQEILELLRQLADRPSWVRKQVNSLRG